MTEAPIETLSTQWSTLAEDSEVAAWLDLWRAVPAPTALESGMHYETIGTAVALVNESAPVWLLNRVLKLGIDRPASDDDLDALVALYANKGLDFAVSLAPQARPADLEGRLLARGFEKINVWAKMVRGAQDCAPPVADFRIEEAGPERASLFAEVAAAGFGTPPAWQALFRAAVGRPRSHAYLAFEGEAPAGVGVLSVHEGVGHLNTAATLPASRERGVQGALMAHRIRAGLALGCRAFATETGLLRDSVNHSYHNMLRCGFRLAYERPNYVRRHAGRAAG